MNTERGLTRLSDGMEKTTMRNTMVTLGRMVALCALVGLMAVSQGCDERNGDGGLLGIVGIDPPPPPVSVTFRTSLMTGYVLQLHNRSSNRIVARVYVENEGRNQSTSATVSIAPNEMEELGVLEMNWAFEPWEKGRVSVDGFKKDIHFEIYEGGKYEVRTELRGCLR